MSHLLHKEFKEYAVILESATSKSQVLFKKLIYLRYLSTSLDIKQLQLHRFQMTNSRIHSIPVKDKKLLLVFCWLHHKFNNKIMDYVQVILELVTIITRDMEVRNRHLISKDIKIQQFVTRRRDSSISWPTVVPIATYIARINNSIPKALFIE